MTIAPRPGMQNARSSSSMPSSLPRPTSSCAGATPYNAANCAHSASGCGCGYRRSRPSTSLPLAHADSLALSQTEPTSASLRADL